MKLRYRLLLPSLLVFAIISSSIIGFWLLQSALNGDVVATEVSPDGKFTCTVRGPSDQAGNFTVAIKTADGRTLSNGTWRGFGNGFEQIQRDQNHVVVALGESRDVRADGVCVTDHVVWLPVTDDRGLEMLEGAASPFELELRSDKITNAGLQHLRKCPGLKSLALYGPPFSDESIKSLGQVPGLEELTLRGSGFTDAALDNLSIIYKLKILSLQSTAVSESRFKAARSAYRSVLMERYSIGPTMQPSTYPTADTRP